MQKINQWHQFETATQVAETICAEIIQLAEQAISETGNFKIVLAGGSTPEKVYQLLVNVKTDWSKWMIYYGDERSLPAGDEERNSVKASQALLDRKPTPFMNRTRKSCASC